MHPELTDLALYAGDELGWFSRRRIRRHLAACPDCREEVDRFREARLGLEYLAAEPPPGVNWTRLSAEMRGNIRVGLAAGECVGPVAAAGATSGWRAALVTSFLAVVVAAGWLLTPKPAPRPAVETAGPRIESTATGLEWTQAGRSLTLMHPSDRLVTCSASLGGSVRARYVDAETGQVTIHHVYME